MTQTNLYTLHDHKHFNIRMRLVSTENDYYYLRSHHWTWFGTRQEFAMQFQPIAPTQEQKETSQ